MSGLFPIVHEKPKETFICNPGRTHNRIRSLRLAASGQKSKVGKGSRQIRSVTSGKGLALRIEQRGSSLAAAVVSLLLEAFGLEAESVHIPVEGFAWSCVTAPVQRTIISELERASGIRLFN